MYRSRLLFIFSLINFIAVLVCIFLLPSAVPIKFNENYIIIEMVTRWYNIIIPSLQVIACAIVMTIDLRNKDDKYHVYRYIVTFVAVAIAMYYTWGFITIQFQNLQIGDFVELPTRVLILIPIAMFMVAYGYYQSNKKFGTKSIFAFKFVKEYPIVWQKTHKVAGVLSSFSGVVIIAISVINEIIFKTNWIYLIVIGVWVVIYYLFTSIYAYKESRFYHK